MATLTFHGAAQQVTGSCYLIESGKHRLLLECGLLQGEDRDNDKPGFAFDPTSIDAVIISHAHLDHSGNIPLLVKQGFDGPIYTSSATADLLPIMYRDAASLQLSDIDRKNRRLLRSGRKPIEPPYDMDDVERALYQVVGVDYARAQNILPGIELKFNDAGHILGSSIVELWLNEKKLVFSGDLGNSCAPLMNDPDIIEQADILLLESTYGDRNHRPLDDTLEEFKQVIEAASQSGGNVLIPAFAVGRTQDLIYWLGQLYHEGRLNNNRVYIDSPMAIKVSDVYERHHKLFNQDDPHFRNFVKQGWEQWLPVLSYTQTTEDSIALNRISDGAIIIAGSGMCTGGRILHHLKYNLWKQKTHLVIVGFQAYGTLGRVLVDGATMVKIFGDDIAVRARIHTLGGFSAHAGQNQLIEWATQFKSPRPRLYLVHGETQAMQSLQRRFVVEHQWDAYIPSQGEVISL